jgi:thymidylate kinase
LSYLKKQSSNSLFNAVINSFNYFFDTLKNIKSNTGFIITFSGVDGAGKTTVIENIAFRIEKQFRKPVVVLRHRPSILPILSAWSKGKEKAHLDTISNLPRQGKNKSFLSSLFRFSYYYLDYLIGQFVIYFKYIFRGYVVIYDRYYFDFINDSKRSNIVLPKSFTTIGYRFLLKPKFNFFLFADTKTILKRKQELNESTINELTKDYNFLFQNLQLTTNSIVYKSINNEDLETTLTNIINTIIKK